MEFVIMFFERFDYKECQGELVEPGAIYNKVCSCLTRHDKLRLTTQYFEVDLSELFFAEKTVRRFIFSFEFNKKEKAGREIAEAIR
jgi:hypothetical protein